MPLQQLQWPVKTIASPNNSRHQHSAASVGQTAHRWFYTTSNTLMPTCILLLPAEKSHGDSTGALRTQAAIACYPFSRRTVSVQFDRIHPFRRRVGQWECRLYPASHQSYMPWQSQDVHLARKTPGFGQLPVSRSSRAKYDSVRNYYVLNTVTEIVII